MKLEAGAKAEELFEKQASEYGLIPQRLSQDKESFAPYAAGSKGNSIKRGDFLLRAANNVEIEVKCLTKYKFEGDIPTYFFKYHDLKKHENMQRISGSPVLLAIYELDGDIPKSDSLRMIRIDTLLDSKVREKFYDDEKKCIVFSTDLMQPGFALIDEIMKKRHA